jgi:hypothetical protein
MFTAMAWPRPVIDSIIDELLSYMKPLASRKQQTLIATLESMKTRLTHEEAYPTEYKKAAKNGKNWLKRLEMIRKDTYTIKDIYSQNKDLIKWWNNL